MVSIPSMAIADVEILEVKFINAEISDIWTYTEQRQYSIVKHII